MTTFQVRTDGGRTPSGQLHAPLWSTHKQELVAEAPRMCNAVVPADLYAIIKTTEKLERAFVRDAIGAEEYEEACGRLIGQFKVLWSSMKDSVRMRTRNCIPTVGLQDADAWATWERTYAKHRRPPPPWARACMHACMHAHSADAATRPCRSPTLSASCQTTICSAPWRRRACCTRACLPP